MKKRSTNYFLSVGLATAIMVSGLGNDAGMTKAFAKSPSKSVVENVVAKTQEDVSETETPAPSEKPKETQTPAPTPKPTANVKKWKAVTGVKLVRFSTKAVKVTWKKHSKAKYYGVYYAKEKNGKFHFAGMTKKTHFLVKKLKNKKTYYFYVQAYKNKKRSTSASLPSARKHIKMKTYKRKIVFAGDSICEGVGCGQAFPKMHSSAKKKVVAYRGLNTVTFHTKRVFNGRTGLQKLVAEKPYRVYMMLGMNEVHYRKVTQMIQEYKDMIEYIKQTSPKTDIVLCAVSPVTRAERARHSGMKMIPVFNKKLKKLAKKMHTHYFDYTAFLKDSGGYLKSQYSAGDGYHWKPAAYVKFGTVVGKYDKSLDQ